MPYTTVTFVPQREISFAAQDQNLFLTKTFFTRSYFLSSTDSTTSTRYFKDERGAQGLYIPVGTNCTIRATGIVWSFGTAGTGSLVESVTSVAVSRDDSNFFFNGGTSAVTIGSASTIPGETAGNVTIQVARNTTVNACEFTCVKATNAPTGLIRAMLVVEFINYPFFNDTIANETRTPGTAALSLAE